MPAGRAGPCWCGVPSSPDLQRLVQMPDQHAATTLTAAAVVAAILVARTAVLCRIGRSRYVPLRPPSRAAECGAGTGRPNALPLDEAASRAAREAPNSTSTVAGRSSGRTPIRPSERPVHRSWGSAFAARRVPSAVPCCVRTAGLRGGPVVRALVGAAPTSRRRERD